MVCPIYPPKPLAKNSKFNLCSLSRIRIVSIRSQETRLSGQLQLEIIGGKTKQKKSADGRGSNREAEFEEAMEKNSER